LPTYSATDTYVEQPETHERIAIGECTSDSDVAIESHLKKMNDEIKEFDEKLYG
jgi:hypothetical protein